MRPDSDPILTTAAAVADDVLVARALDVDRRRAPLRPSLDAVADAGLYGLHAPRSVGGLGADVLVADHVVELLAGGCLTTAFTWIQHQGVVKRLVAAGGDLAADVLPRLATGSLRAGVAVGGVRPGRDQPLSVTSARDGWSLSGDVPWITGWGHVDVLLVAARTGAGDVAWLLVDAPPVEDPGGAARSLAPTVTIDRVEVVACDAANSAVVGFDGHVVGRERLVGTQPHDEWMAADAAGLRGNGSLSLGVAGRCAALLDDAELRSRIDEVRGSLDGATTEELPRARAVATLLVWDAAQRLLVETGGRGVGLGDHAQRLAREAAFLQVFATRPAITAAQRSLLVSRGVG